MLDERCGLSKYSGMGTLYMGRVGWLTCDGLSMSGTLSAGNEDDIALSGADIVALQEEELIDAVVLEGCDLDDSPNRAGEALLDDEVLLALDLSRQTRWVNEAGP